MAERVARKKGQHRGSSSHSDLYTDENPKGTIHGLKFATQKDAKASVNKIKSSGKSHAHKIQAAIAMEQRAKAAGKVSAAGEYRKFINMMKKKTKAKNENITIPIKVGDTVLGGKFKNKRIVVKSIGKNDKGDITINGRPLLKFRIVKENIEVEFPEDMPMDENVSPQVLKALNLGLKKINRKFKGASLDGKTIDIELHPGHNRDSEIHQIYDLLKKLKLDKNKTSIFNESINEQRPIPMDAPNEFVYMDFKKWVYKNRKMVKQMMLKQKGDSTKMFLILSALWYKWARKSAPMFTFIKDKKKFGRELMILMVDDDLIFDKETFKKTNRINQVKEIYYDNLGRKCPGPVTLDGRCLHGRNTYQKEGVGMNRTLHKDVGPHDDELNEVGIFKISQFTKGIIPPGRLDTNTPQAKKDSIKLIKNFHSMLNAFWGENDIPYRARLR